jgi:cytochrome b subunit of formate dehydrogenase
MRNRVTDRPGGGPSPPGADRDTDEPAPRFVRYRRPARFLHAAVYILTFVLLYTGWWLLSGHEGRPSALARAFDVPDVLLHQRVGWVLLAVVAFAVIVGVRGTITFVRETVRFRRSDLRWLARWPRAAFDGRFPPHDGHFDPGQRLLNVLVVATLAVLAATGIGLLRVHGGPDFVWLLRAHKLAIYALVAIVVGHMVVASGILPGYRGVWRSMHLGGRVPHRVARRLWPGWARRQQSNPASVSEPATPPTPAPHS